MVLAIRSSRNAGIIFRRGRATFVARHDESVRAAAILESCPPKFGM